MRTLPVFVAALALAGCAAMSPAGGGEVVAPQSTPLHLVNRAPDLAASQTFDARAEARRFDHAADCELEARSLRARNADRAWKLLRACIDRGDFTELRALLDGPWDQDLKSRADAGELLTRLIAARGGDIESDVALLHDHKVPVFTLSDAVEQPEVYAGRFIVMRARVSDLRKRDGQVTVQLDEYAHSSDVVYAPVGRGRQHTSEVSLDGHDGAGHEQQRTVSRDRDVAINRRTVTDDVETGRQALGKLAQVDPFFEPNKDFVILARFDGVRERAEADDGDAPVAAVTVLHYFRPGALAMY